MGVAPVPGEGPTIFENVNVASEDDLERRAFFDYEILKNFIHYDASPENLYMSDQKNILGQEINEANAALEELYFLYQREKQKRKEEKWALTRK